MAQPRNSAVVNACCFRAFPGDLGTSAQSVALGIRRAVCLQRFSQSREGRIRLRVESIHRIDDGGVFAGSEADAALGHGLDCALDPLSGFKVRRPPGVLHESVQRIGELPKIVRRNVNGKPGFRSKCEVVRHGPEATGEPSRTSATPAEGEA
jgi:hypothetical protein